MFAVLHGIQCTNSVLFYPESGNGSQHHSYFTITKKKLNPSGKSGTVCPRLWDVEILLPFSAMCSHSQPLLFLRKVIFKREAKS